MQSTSQTQIPWLNRERLYIMRFIPVLRLIYQEMNIFHIVRVFAGRFGVTVKTAQNDFQYIGYRFGIVQWIESNRIKFNGKFYCEQWATEINFEFIFLLSVKPHLSTIKHRTTETETGGGILCVCDNEPAHQAAFCYHKNFTTWQLKNVWMIEAERKTKKYRILQFMSRHWIV